MHRNHVQRPRLSLVAKWTKYITKGFTKLKKVTTGQASRIVVEC
jgi:hypothetical protein